MTRTKLAGLLRKVAGRIEPGMIVESVKEPLLTPWEIYSKYVRIHPTTILDPAATIKIFNPPDPPAICLEIGEGSHIFSSFNFLRPDAKITIGKNCQIGAVNFVCAESIKIGDDVLMAWGITIMDTDAHAIQWEHRKNDVSQCYEDYLRDRSNFIRNKDWSHVKTEGIRIGNRVWAGFNASILKGVTIEDESIIGAGSVVTESMPSRCVVNGNPARIVRRIETDE